MRASRLFVVALAALVLVIAATLLAGCGASEETAEEEIEIESVEPAQPSEAAEPEPATESEQEPESTEPPQVVAVEATNGKLAFMSDLDGGFDLFVIEPDGTGLVNLTNTPTRVEVHPSWSGDGTRLAYAGEVDGQLDIYTMRSDGKKIKQVTDDAEFDQRPSLSPDGTVIAYVRSDDVSETKTLGDIYLVPASGGELTRLTDNGLSSNPDWSPDGTRLVFTGPRDFNLAEELFFGKEENLEIYVMNADGSELTRLTDNEAQDERPGWSPDGTKIVFASDRDGDFENYDIFVMNADGTDATNLTKSATDEASPIWSPDGTQIAFVGRDDEGTHIYVMNADGSDRRIMVENVMMGLGIGPDPAWQPLLPGVTPAEAVPIEDGEETEAPTAIGDIDLAAVPITPDELPSGLVVADETYADMGPSLASYQRFIVATGDPVPIGEGDTEVSFIISVVDLFETEEEASAGIEVLADACRDPSSFEEFLEASLETECGDAETLTIEGLGDEAAGGRAVAEDEYRGEVEVVLVTFRVGRTVSFILALGPTIDHDDVVDLAQAQASRAGAAVTR